MSCRNLSVHLVSALGALAFSLPALAAEDPHIARIEADLQPALQIKGAPLVRHTLAEEMAAHHLPALTIAVADEGRIVWAKAYGLADVSSGVKATPETAFQAASISKPVAASAAMQLIAEGKLQLDAPVNASLKSWRLPDSPLSADHPVTLRHLLTHTGGLTVHGFPGYDVGAPLPTVVQILEGAPPANTGAVVVEQKPGTVWNYSGGGITVAQLMMTDATGDAFPELMRKRVLEPLGMRHSTYDQTPDAPSGVRATGYLVDGSPVPGRYHIYPEMAAAGLWTTPSDLVTWALGLQRAHAGAPARLMSQASAKAMLTPGLGDWGLGIGVNSGDGAPDARRFSHGGDNFGFKAQMVGYMTGGRAIAVMTNGDSGQPVLKEVVAAIARAYGWKGFETRVVEAAPLSPEQRAELAGSYGQGAVRIVDAKPFMEARVYTTRYTLIPQGSGAFLTRESGLQISLLRGPDGRITGVLAGGETIPRDP